ncbi:uncharacterized protein LOC104585266 [Brachypodium distachyon]|uniref:Uncharacterized protein n=1 Tax=Brachypodium distachyon TaxID=15368 RepID=I1IVU9_BRADI|nr:uncharacterized protein LOC104585266 [Brachypodium distachyon]KQJ81646.1 hypothetical protein BRADI_5g02000v3 [Brachypodium distachyon]|eukprot:XP_010239661.1 uncharacterized protein LOC104585266 [Brachypodium distachyon]
MAMRSVLSKVPRLGLRPSWAPTAHALSPAAAGSRLISTNLPSTAAGGEQIVYSKENLAEQLASINRTYAENKRRFDAEYKEIIQMIREQEAANIEAFRQNKELDKKILEKVNEIEKQTNFVCVGSAILVILTMIAL